MPADNGHTTLAFPDGFMWGVATAAHQVEGDNRNSDWWAWELRSGTPVAEPSGTAIEHYARYANDSALLAGLGYTTYRFSVEWARVEPAEGSFDEDAIRHYRDVTEAVRDAGMTPMVTLNHFTLPAWLARRGGWMSPDTPSLFARYCARVATALGDLVEWYCTINEPGAVAFGGYAGALGFPPGTTDLGSWNTAITGLKQGHTRGRAAVKEMRPEARAGATHSMTEYQANSGGRPIMEFLRHQMEDTFLEACQDDDFIGVQTYTRAVINVPSGLAPVTRALVNVGLLRRLAMTLLLRRGAALGGDRSDGVRRTDMGYEYRPQAVAATVRRVAGVLPGKDIVVTEHGIATSDDQERVEFITDGLAALHGAIAGGVPVRGYIHWSAFDNFEWALGYRMRFGIVAVDRTTQERHAKPSATLLGEIARANAVVRRRRQSSTSASRTVTSSPLERPS
jgi:beta-glucosidase